MKPPTNQQRSDPFKVFLRSLYIISLAIYVFFILDGIDYYRTSYQERPHHGAYRQLRPAGFTGHGFGILGTTMMLLMLLYSVRKRTSLFGEWGALRRWLDIHIYFGIMGPLFIILHTSFKVQGLVAVSFWSMIAVATSGVLGRYLYLQIPRNRRGGELSLKEIEAMNQQFNQQLTDELQLNEDQFNRLEELRAANIDQKRNVFILLLSMVVKDILRPLRVHRLKRMYVAELGLSGQHLQDVVDLSYQQSILQRRIILLDRIQQLFHYWHVFHKPFAIIMYIIMLVHVGVAIWLGYTWIF
ncbi:MAG: hypothetical protein GWN16_00490 [Calditrichae bacterium]|nr:hypothetical protein [Calditrichia bacterium]